jgi:hypothetical protein
VFLLRDSLFSFRPRPIAGNGSSIHGGCALKSRPPLKYPVRREPGVGVIVPNRMPVIIVAALLLVGAAAAIFYFARSPATSPSTSSVASGPSSRTPESTPVASPTPASRPSARPASRAAAPEPGATPAPAPTTGTLIIESDVPDTSVFLDRVYLGKAPVTATGVAPGPHRVNLSATGYEGFVDTIDVVPGPRTLSIKFKEIRLDVSLAVVHKHALGSCAGTLRATPKGLTYDTTNKADAFSAALTDLETFTMDYLEKTLRVKVKGGKSYNFTDPEANVNRLYLFHQEIDKARQRLMSGR